MTELTVTTSPSAGRGSDDGGKCILVVDDEPTVLAVTARMLASAGYDVMEAPSAREALRLLELSDPRVDLIITDVVMPETDGRMLGRLVGERHPGLPVLYMSAYAHDDVLHRGAPGPSLPFLRKPFTVEALMALVQQLIAA